MSTAAAAPGIDWPARARALAIATMAYNALEGVVSMGFGLSEDSIALLGFGVDSWVEVGSAAVVYWKLSSAGGFAPQPLAASPTASRRWVPRWSSLGGGSAPPGAPGCATTARERERVATRWIGRLFVALAMATATGAAIQLTAGGHPASTLPGVIISVLSLSFMVFLWRAKAAAAVALDSKALAMDAACSRACIQLSAVLLAGSAVYALAPSLWWADAAAALVLSAMIGREGWEAIQAANKREFSGGCGCGS